MSQKRQLEHGEGDQLLLREGVGVYGDPSKGQIPLSSHHLLSSQNKESDVVRLSDNTREVKDWHFYVKCLNFEMLAN